jgi:hypothetical protein
MPRFTVDTFVGNDVLREVGAGDTLLAALEDFADIGWEEDAATLLKTVVWVRDDQDNVVGTGHYRMIDLDGNMVWPILEVMAIGGPVHDGFPIMDTVYRFWRIPDGGSYRVSPQHVFVS